MRENPKATQGNASGTGAVRANPERADRVRTPRMSGRRRREGWLLPLCLLIPPVGVAYMWAMQRYTLRMRVIVSVLAGMLLFVECYFMFSDTAGQPDATKFTPGAGSVYAPASVTAEPTAEPGVTELPYDVVVATPDVPGGADVSEPTVDPGTFVPNDPVVTEGFVANTGSGGAASADTPVYTSEGSLFYHAGSVCGDKEYPTQVTLSQALENGLAPCNNCTPPTEVG